jgi:Fic family protein
MSGMEVKIKHLVKLFEPKTLKQAYNLASLLENTISYQINHHSNLKHSTHTMT